ncbi:MAG: glycosyltransferase N-terminal domain-containing protein [Pyrinomonadaceae bacterium]
MARASLQGLASQIIYCPLDFRFAVKRALNRVRPALVLLMETEVWPHFLRACHKRRIPVAIVNGRISPTSFQRYRVVRSFFSLVLNQLSLAVMQTGEDAERIRNLGIKAEIVRVSGNLKFDAKSLSSHEQSLTAEIANRFHLNRQQPVLVAASTHAPEERVTIDAFRALLLHAASPKPRLVIAPRHPERFEEVAELLDKSGLSWSRRTGAASQSDGACDVVLLDTVGELRSIYPLAGVVFVGGSIAKKGGHNLIEPAAEACCVITGAHTDNFAGIVDAFAQAGAVVQLPPLEGAAITEALSHCWRELLTDDGQRSALAARACATVEAHRGATARTLELIEPLINANSISAETQVRQSCGLSLTV